MQKQVKCDHCNKKADAKIGDEPQYLCADCWMKLYANKGKKHGQGTIH